MIIHRCVTGLQGVWCALAIYAENSYHNKRFRQGEDAMIARDFPVFTVTSKAERSLRAGHPWVYGEEVTAV